MSFEIQPATTEDAPALADIFLAAFSDKFNRTLFPVTPNVREWWTNKFTEDCVNPPANDILLKAVDTSAKTETGENVVAAFAIWNQPPSDPNAVNQCKMDKFPPWPEDSDKGLCDKLIGDMEEQRERFVGGRRHYYLDMLGTHPTYQGRGAGTKLLKWGLAKADHDGVEAYVSASPEGKPLYEKYGFVVVDNEEIFPDHIQTYLLRPKGKSG